MPLHLPMRAWTRRRDWGETQSEREDGCDFYEVEFTKPRYFSYEYDIDAATGRVLDYKCDWDDDRGAPDGVTQEFVLTEAESLALALAHAGVDETIVTVRETRTYVEKGVSLYEFEFYSAKAEYEYLVSGSSGILLEYECDWYSYRDM